MEAKILIVDDHNMVIEGLKSILAQLPHIEVIATAMNAFEAIEALRMHTKINLVLSDINLPDISGIELCAKIKKEFPAVEVIALSTFNQRSYVSQMIQNGATGYLVKSANAVEIDEAIQTVLSGKMYISNDINNETIVAASSDDAPTLTRREKEILIMIAEGMTNNEIADKIFVSHYTVDTHRKNLLIKFEVGNTALLIKKAAGFGLL
jgi:two-component system, NarL family, nitrate/nitrite response regulator NarL